MEVTRKPASKVAIEKAVKVASKKTITVYGASKKFGHSKTTLLRSLQKDTIARLRVQTKH